MIPFNKFHFTGKEIEFMNQAVQKGTVSGNGHFTKMCQEYFKKAFQFEHNLLTTSATSALELASILCDIQPGDEVILPSFTFVSTATPFALRGANLVFCDSETDHPNLDTQQLRGLITPNTKVIVVVHYAGMSCDMTEIMSIANAHDILVIEDAAHSITSKYENQYLGSIGHLSVFSFHETKNVSSGEGGMLVINDPSLVERAKVVWAKGTNRIAMEEGLVSKYEWMDLGSSHYPSDINAAILYAQLQHIEQIQNKRAEIWSRYFDRLSELQTRNKLKLPLLKTYQSNNYHMFYLLCKDETERNELIEYLKEKEILAVFHYLPLHISPFIKSQNKKLQQLPNAQRFSETIVRLPLFVDLSLDQVDYIAESIIQFYQNQPLVDAQE